LDRGPGYDWRPSPWWVDGTWRSLVSALVWGTRGRRFKSGRPDDGAGVVDARGPWSTNMNVEATEPPPGAPDRRLFTVPNALSLLRLATVPAIVFLFVTDRTEAAVVLYAAAAWTDFLDGYIARRTGAVTEFGKLLDPLADRVLVIALAVSLVASGALSIWIALVIVVRDVLVLSLFPVLERKGIERIQVNLTGKAATASLLFGLTWLAWSETTFPLNGIGRTVGLVFTVLGAVAYWIAAGLYGREILVRLNRPKSAGAA
jgi:cardiolipin synthase (CMP-forming)